MRVVSENYALREKIIYGVWILEFKLAKIFDEICINVIYLNDEW